MQQFFTQLINCQHEQPLELVNLIVFGFLMELTQASNQYLPVTQHQRSYSMFYLYTQAKGHTDFCTCFGFIVPNKIDFYTQ